MISDILIRDYRQFPSNVEEEFLWEWMREIRDAELKATDYWALADFTMTQAQKDYRQELRDLPNTFTPTLDENRELDLSNFPVYIEPQEI